MKMNLNKSNLLITTSLEQTWFKSSSYQRTYLTEACRLFSRKDEWEKFEGIILAHHWNDRNKFKKDADYLQEFYLKVLEILTENLNKLNNTNKPVDYWRIVIGPWLIHYMSILFDRWETIRIAYQNNNNFVTASIPKNHEHIIAEDFEGFMKIMQTDEWNFQVYYGIINYGYSKNTVYLNLDEFNFNNLTDPSPINIRSTLKNICKQFINESLNFLNLKSKIFIYSGYFKPLNLSKLFLRLGQIPTQYIKVFDYSFKAKHDFSYRKTYAYTHRSLDFENYFLLKVIQDIPIVYLEAFKEVQYFVEKIPFKPKKILTANAHWGLDIFKFWLGLQKVKGSKILISSHGGSFPALFDFRYHEEAIADCYISWFKSLNIKHIQLPPNKLCGFSIEKKIGVFCSLIGFESPRYVCSATASPMPNNVIDCFNQTIIFCEALNIEIQDKLKIRPYPNMGLETKLRYIDRLGSTKVNDSESFYDLIENSKLIVCTYPQTTFSEAMASGKPVILIYFPNYFELVEEASDLIDILMDANIVFTDVKKAATHINKVWSNLDNWWRSIEVLNARNKFHEMALNQDKNWLTKWVYFLKNV
jgi:putative transferase (TIGR04331 family)